MGEIDTKPIEPVQVALDLFEKKAKNRTRGRHNEEMERGMDWMLKALASYKLQVEANNSAYSELMLELEHCRNFSEELLTLLMNCEFEKSVYLDECREAKFQVNELESKILEMTCQVSEAERSKGQLSHELNSVETELAAAREDKCKALNEAEEMKAVANMEKERAKGLENQVSRLHEAIAMLKAEWNSDRTATNQLKMELQNANDEVNCLKRETELIRKESKGLKAELKETKEKENEALIEIALTKSEIHMARSQLAAAKAAEARASSVKSGLYLAVQQLAVEVDNAKKENQRLTRGTDTFFPESDDQNRLSQAVQTSPEPEKNLNDSNITIPLEQYEKLIKMPEKVNKHSREPSTSESTSEVNILKNDLEVAATKIEEYRILLQQATTRARITEKSKAALEDQISELRECKQRRKPATVANDRKSQSSTGIKSPAHEHPPKKYQPLYKILNMKF